MSRREELGKLVRDVWIATAEELLPNPKPSWLVPWDELDDEFQREVDMRIGEAVAADERRRINAAAMAEYDAMTDAVSTATPEVRT